jgi:hypothetical protein
LPVGIFAVIDAEIVRWRRDNKIDVSISKPRHSFDAILALQIEPGHEINLAESREIVQRKNGGRVLVLGTQAAGRLFAAAFRELACAI